MLTIKPVKSIFGTLVLLALAGTAPWIYAQAANSKADVADRHTRLPCQGSGCPSEKVDPAGAGVNGLVPLAQGAYSASHNQTGGGNNGIANSIRSGCSGSGCQVVADPPYSLTEFPSYFSGNINASYIGVGTINPQGTEIFDYRGGRSGHVFNDPYLQLGNNFIGEFTTDIRTKQGPTTPVNGAAYTSRTILQENLGNGSNDPLLGKTTTSALAVFQYNYQQGQHIALSSVNFTHAIGDTLAETLRSQSNGGYRNAFDEGTHLHDTYAIQDPTVFQGTCTTGCSVGSQSITMTATNGAGTQGDGRILYDTSASDTTAFSVSRIADSNPRNLMLAGNFSSEFTKIIPVSQTFAPSQITTLTSAVSASSFDPSQTYTFPVKTTAGFTTGLACLADESYSAYSTFEWVNITSIRDSMHLVSTMKYSHPLNSVLTQGGMCGKVYAMQADTYTLGLAKPLRRVFPVMGSLDGSSLWVFSGASLQSAMQSSFLNATLAASSLVRSSNTVTLTLPANAPSLFAPTGLIVTIAGASDSSFDGTFKVLSSATSGAGRWTTLVWTQTGADSSAAGETANLQSPNPTANMYYGAEVYSVLGANKDTSDNKFLLSPNIVPFTANQTLEEAEWMQQRVAESFNFQTVYFPDVISNDPVLGYGVQGLMNSQRVGYSINNETPTNLYAGHGGSNVPPAAFLYNGGLWNYWMGAKYAPEIGLINLPCKLSGCSGGDAAIGIVQTPNNGANLQYDPNNFTWSWWIPGQATPLITICCGSTNVPSSKVTLNTPLIANLGVSTPAVVTTSLRLNGSHLLTGTRGNSATLATFAGASDSTKLAATDSNGNVISSTIPIASVCLSSGANCPAATAISKGRATLSSGTVMVTTTAASRAGTYVLTNCGASGKEIGVLSVGAVTAGTSFVINSLTATNAVATGDTSTVCWMIQ